MKRGIILACLFAASVLASLLAGCERAPSAPADPPAGPDTAPGTPPVEAIGAGRPDADPADARAVAMPTPVHASAFVVSTNEPFWQARVEDGAVVLDGPEVAGRRFAIEREETEGATRLVHARDGAGMIVVKLTAGPCQDSMSGAEFPYAGELVVDGVGPTRGCARPADLPPPRPRDG